MKKYITDFYSTRHLLSQLMRQRLVLRYRRTFLGYLWTLINPIISMTITSLVFSSLFKVDFEEYLIYLFAGLIPWNCFQSIITQSSGSILANEGLLKKIYLPKILIPISYALIGLVDSISVFLILCIVVLFIDRNIYWTFTFIPLAFLLIFIFSLGIALILSVASVFYRDVQNIINVILQMVFFVTPILYKKNNLSGVPAILVEWNPLTPFIQIFRDPIHDHMLPSAGLVFSTILLAFSSLLIGIKIFTAYDHKLVYRL